MSINNTRDSPTASPCIGRCSVSFGHDVCRGCGRSVEEIRDWNSMDITQKIQVKELAKARKLALSQGVENDS